MKAIILAAGQGTRFSHDNEAVPKCMLPIGDTTLLNIQVDTLHECGVSNIVLVRGYKKEKIDIPGIHYYDNDEYRDTNVLYSLLMAEQELDQELLILYSDIYYDKDCIRNMLQQQHDIIIGCIDHREALPVDAEMVEYNNHNVVEHIGVSLPASRSRNRAGFNGILRLTQEGCEKFRSFLVSFKLACMENDSRLLRNALITDVLSEMIRSGIIFHTVNTGPGWFEVNTRTDYEQFLNLGALRGQYLKTVTDWTKRSEKYNRLDWVNNNRLLQEFVEAADNITPDARVLDIGTGTGKVLHSLHKTKGTAEYHGIDISAAMLDKIDPASGFHLKVADVTNLDLYPEDHFNCVTARMVFHHVHAGDRAMQEIYKKLQPGGQLIICEGNPPSYRTLDFYKEMFFYKEDRIAFMETDLINLFVRNGYRNIITRTVILPDMSLNNWLDNSGIPNRNIDIIKRMHYECAPEVRADYNMKNTTDDILMDWKFSIVSGEK